LRTGKQVFDIIIRPLRSKRRNAAMRVTGLFAGAFGNKRVDLFAGRKNCRHIIFL